LPSGGYYFSSTCRRTFSKRTPRHSLHKPASRVEKHQPSE
jgi:hypothetical protein